MPIFSFPQVFYVWFDAPLGYPSMTACYTKDWEQWWKNPDNVEHYEFMAKDNVPFHGIVFPASQLGTKKDWTMVKHLMATEYLNYEDAKFSKSRGIGVFGNDAQDTGIPSDIWRFYLLYTRPENQDSAFQWDDLALKTSELLGNFGNFVNRAVKFCRDNFASSVTQMKLTEDDQKFLAQVTRHLERYIDLLEVAKERDALSQILSISRLGNQLMQASKPWVLVKSASEEDRMRAGTVVSLCVNVACLLSVLVEPFMPTIARSLKEQLNVRPSELPILSKKFPCLLPPGHKIGTPALLIQEIKADEIKDFKKRFAGSQDARKGGSENAKASSVTGPDPAKAKELEIAVTAQGDAVRQLKESKAEKDVIKIEVEKLLALKKQLAIAEGKDPNEKPAGGKGKKSKK